MKNKILKILVVLGLFYTSNILAMTQEKYQEIINSYKLVDSENIDNYTILDSTHITTYNEYKNLLKSNNFEDSMFFARFRKIFKINEENIKLGINPSINRNIIVTGISYPKANSLSSDNLFDSIINDQKLYTVICFSKNKELIVSSILESLTKDKQNISKELPLMTFNYFRENRYVENSFNFNLVEEKHTLEIDEIFFYFNEEKILAKLYKTKTCDKELTEKANIEVLINDKWLPQKNSWNINNSD